jgi:hypothetical protein
LQLKPYRKAVIENPARQVHGGQFVMGWRKEDRILLMTKFVEVNFL